MTKKLVVLLLVIALAPTAVHGQEIKVNWVVHSDPTAGDDLANAVCIHGDYIYVVGVANGSYYIDIANRSYYIEKRRKVDGRLVKAQMIRGGEPFNCLVVNDKLYIVGIGGRDRTPLDEEWVILVLDLDLKVLKHVKHNPSGRIDGAIAIDSDGNYIYIAGVDSLPRNYQWRVEKRRIDDLELVRYYTSNPSNRFEATQGIGVNPKTKHVWIVGYDQVEDNPMWRIEILDEDLNLVKVIRPGIRSSACAIAFDEEGNAYVAGWGAVVKFDKDGREVARHEKGEHEKVLYSEGLVYTAGGEKIGNYTRHVLYVFNKSLKLVDKLVLSEGISADAEFWSGRIAFDGKNLYIAGCDYLPGNYRWTIYSINIPLYLERYEWLKKEYEKLRAKYDELRRSYDRLMAEHSHLRKEHELLKDKYERIQLLSYALLIAVFALATVFAITVLYFVRKRGKA